MKTARMKLLELLLLLRMDSLRLFLEKICTAGTSAIGRATQPKTLFQIYDAYVRFTKLCYRHLAIEFGYTHDDEGNPLSDHQMFLQAPVLTLKDFRKGMDEYLGAAHPENRPSARGFGYPNVYVKDILIFWLHVPQVREIIKDFDALLETMDRIKTVEDSIESVQAFHDFAKPYVLMAFNEMSEKKALAMQNGNERMQELLACYLLSQQKNG